MNDSLNKSLNYQLEIQQSIKYGDSNISKFNHKGNILCSGCIDGLLTFWDFQSKSVALVIRHPYYRYKAVILKN